MSKITFRADDDLVRRLEAFDASKSEVMREALREYLDGSERSGTVRIGDRESLDRVIAERVDAVLADRLDGAAAGRGAADARDVNLTITLDGAGEAAVSDAPGGAGSDSDADAGETTGSECKQCGEHVRQGAVYCPNCGEKAAHRVFCECGDELRTDWSFCPGCGRRTAAADVLDGA